MSTVLRTLAIAAGLLLVWQVVVSATGVPRFILPGPLAVGVALIENAGSLARHAAITALEIVLGLIVGTALGAGCALVIAQWRRARGWLLPVLVASQAIPVFALAPILVLWLGYGLASKIAMASLIIFFPVTASFLDGLGRTESGWLDLARVMTAGRPGRQRAVLWRIRLPAALPAFASGLRVAAAVAPIGAVVGEWVGASAGLGYLMLHMIGRAKTDLVFAALLLLCLIGLALYFAVDRLGRALTPWQADDNARN